MADDHDEHLLPDEDWAAVVEQAEALEAAWALGAQE